MADERVQRRLAAILAADLAGYSRLMEADEEGTHAQLKTLRGELIDPMIAEHRGRMVKTTGDGMLVEFASAVEAVKFAAEMQSAMARRNTDCPEDKRLVFRIGINIGDIIIDRDDIYGDGVNVAARLEGLAEPGGVCVSASVHQQVKGKVDLQFEDAGAQAVKNIAEPVHVFRVKLGGDHISIPASDTRMQTVEQEIRFCTAVDGVRIAYATVGHGPPLVKTANWLNHLEYDWESPVWRTLLRELARDRLLVRYDERGNGLSDWDADDISFEAFVKDLETVVDATGLERFPLIGMSQGCSVSIAYAVRHPERVSRLILYGGYAVGANRRPTQDEIDRQSALIALMKDGWGKDNPAFRQIFTSLFMPDANTEQMKSFNELQRMTTSPDNAVRLMQAFGEIDVRPLLSEVRAPTLVLHCREDARIPFEQGRQMAMSIPGARLVPLEGRNHIMLEHEPGWSRFLAEVRNFLEADSD